MSTQTNIKNQKFGASSSVLGVGFWVVTLYFCFEYGRFQNYFEPLKYLKIPFILSILAILLLLKLPDKTIFRDRQVIYHFIFMLLMGFSVTFAINTYYVAQTTVGMFIFFIVGVLPSVAFLDNTRKISFFFRIWVFLFLFLSIMTIVKGGHGPGGFLGDENDMALALNIALPFAYFMSKSPALSGFWKMACLFTTIMIALAVVYTSSRGGFLGMVSVIIGMLYFSKNRIRNFVLIVMLAAISLFFVPKSYMGEIESINDQTNSTRLHRLYFWALGWDMFIDNPVLGVGAGNFAWANYIYEVRRPDFDEATTRRAAGRPAHSLYFTLLPEMGFAGTYLFVGIGVLMYRRLKKISEDRNLVLKGPVGEEIRLIAKALLVSLFGFFVSAGFISVLYYPHFWYLNGFSLAMYLVYKKSSNEKGIGVASVTGKKKNGHAIKAIDNQ